MLIRWIAIGDKCHICVSVLCPRRAQFQMFGTTRVVNLLIFVRFFHSNKMKENPGKCRDQKATTFNHINDTELDLQFNQF